MKKLLFGILAGVSVLSVACSGGGVTHQIA